MEETRRQFLRKSLYATGLGAALWLPETGLALPARYHTVKRGENLTVIARRHGTTVARLKAWNGLTSDLIVPGQKLYLAPQYKLLPLTTINRPRINTGKWKNIIAHHSATTNGNAKIFDAEHRRRGMENGLAYHFVIGNGTNGTRDGKVEVGGRWLRQLKGGHVKSAKYNVSSIGICLVGNFEKKHPSKKQVAALVELIDYLKNKTLRGKAKFMVHRELEQTVCPGKNFPVKKLHQLFG